MVVVYRKPFVGIDSDTKETRIGVDEETNISFGKIVDNGCLGEIGHVGQIFEQFVFWRILFFNFII